LSALVAERIGESFGPDGQRPKEWKTDHAFHQTSIDSEVKDAYANLNICDSLNWQMLV
jgi:hypothetical protein